MLQDNLVLSTGLIIETLSIGNYFLLNLQTHKQNKIHAYD